MNTGDDPEPRRSDLKVGAWLGGYRLDRVIGEGGMGIVWQAHDPDLERSIAVKVLRHAEAATTLRRRLLREARAMARLKHPNVLTVYEVGTEGDRDYIAMELVEGDNFDGWLATKPPAEDVWRALLAAGRGLAAAHAAGLVHRDFKPHNVLCGSDGRVLVTDFGLARGLGEDVEAEPAATPPGAIPTNPTLPAMPRAKLEQGLDATLDAREDSRPTPVEVAAATMHDATPNAGSGEARRDAGSGEARRDASSSAKPAHKADSVLDSTLTQTGALIGTPAYMAPEQFAGAPPNPRTDQFAFAVTAWQALTGKRPFGGATLDEMQRAASAGIGDRTDGLPKAVRSVLARGLEPDPAKRWPDLDTLLRQLERTRVSRRMRTVAVAGAMMLAAALAWNLFGRDREPEPAPAVAAPGPCTPAEQQFAPAWSDARRAELFAKYGDSPGFEKLARGFDDQRTRWIALYDQNCKAPDDPRFHLRQGCLLGVRDDTQVRSLLAGRIPRDAIDHFQPYGFLPSLAVCEGPAPVAPPPMPTDPVARQRVLDLRGELFIGRTDPTTLEATAKGVLARDSWDSWEPLKAEAMEALGTAQHQMGRHAEARESYQSALSLANGIGYAQLAAIASVGMLELETARLADPGSTGAIERALEVARSAVKRAGDDPMLLGVIATLEARALLETVELSEDDDALSVYQKATALLSAQVGSPVQTDRRSLVAFDMYVDGMRRRNSDEIAGMRSMYPRPLGNAALDHAIAQIAWTNRDLDEVHRRSNTPNPEPPEGTSRSGRVIGPDGKPVAGATVVAWVGTLAGDGSRVFTDRADVAGDIATTTADGTFTLLAPEGAAIIAELGDLRSSPQPLAGAPTLRLAPTRTLNGTLTIDERYDRDVTLRYDIGPNRWYLATAIAGDATYTLARAPAGGRFGTAGAIGPRSTRRTLTRSPPADDGTPVFPQGPVLDVIVRVTPAEDGDGAAAATTDVIVIRGKHAPRTRADIEALAAREADVAIGTSGPIAADATIAGRKEYRHGDDHAVFTGSAGTFTACAIAKPERTAPATCATVTSPITGSSFATVLPLP